MNDGKMIRVPVPPLTQERRQDMVKHLHKALEEHRTAVRNIRRDGNDAIKKALKDKKITEDEEKRSLDEIQKLTDDEIKKMEEMSKAKEKEVLEIISRTQACGDSRPRLSVERSSTLFPASSTHFDGFRQADSRTKVHVPKPSLPSQGVIPGIPTT